MERVILLLQLGVCNCEDGRKGGDIECDTANGRAERVVKCEGGTGCVLNVAEAKCAAFHASFQLSEAERSLLTKRAGSANANAQRTTPELVLRFGTCIIMHLWPLA